MTQREVKCIFHHVSSPAANLISSLIGIRTEYDSKTFQISCSCSMAKSNTIRSKLADFIRQYPQIWLSIDLPKNKDAPFYPFNTNIGNGIDVSFGSLLSTSKFIVHDTFLNGKTQWTMVLYNEETIGLECHIDSKTNYHIRFTVPIKCLNRKILVIDGDTYSNIILNIDTITADIRMIDNIKSERLHGNHPIIESLCPCSDIIIRISSKSDADGFLKYLKEKNKFEIFYTIISVEHNSCKPWDRIEFNWYPMSESLYGISMLHSLGYLFIDKYLMNPSLQSTMVELAEIDEKRFYQLTVTAYYELKKCHWLDLTAIFDPKHFDHIETETKDQFYYVGVVCLTPTRLYLKPKEKSKGNRVIRHESFQGVNNFCLVYLKPDPSDEYLPNDTNTLVYFQKIFETGIEIGKERYHLFGSSNSQVKEHSFWFIKASSLDEIDQKRLELGELDRIDNVGTYAARLGLWFSESLPTDIKLIHCGTSEEFNRRVRQGETCVVEVKDIVPNKNYCFTDGNGLISKGLAKRVAEKLCLSPKNLQQNIFPSAYQIRLAGCKGLLIVDPQSTMDQFYIKYRPSMKKFQCNHWILDICDYSRPTSTRLNNQIILLLSDLGVPDETFFRLQQQWFNRSSARSIDPDHLKKNKIPLPANECRYMYGCAFESQLKPGTCFIRYQVLNENGKPLPNPRFECVKGPVIVTKNPCPYAGDMLQLIAVDLPELHDLSDVIVFSTQGDRPDFNKIAGSDLDGDGYFVYWGNEFQLAHTEPPLDYIGDPKITHPTRISPHDVINYYLSTLGATSYGEIYNLHAVIVDKNEEKHRRRTCQQLAIELARMFSSAIDSGKTGYVIDKERIQQIRAQYGQEYPDFLMNFGKRYYQSQSIIGKLYRNAVLYKKGDIDQLSKQFEKFNLNDNRLQASSPMPLSSLPVNNPTQLMNSDGKKRTNRGHSGRKTTQ